VTPKVTGPNNFERLRTREREGDREEQAEDRHDDGIDEEGEQTPDPVLLQRRVVTDQINGRRHCHPS
jgi:hypothetical protein